MSCVFYSVYICRISLARATATKVGSRSHRRVYTIEPLCNTSKQYVPGGGGGGINVRVFVEAKDLTAVRTTHVQRWVERAVADRSGNDLAPSCTPFFGTTSDGSNNQQFPKKKEKKCSKQQATCARGEASPLHPPSKNCNPRFVLGGENTYLGNFRGITLLAVVNKRVRSLSWVGRAKSIM